MVEEEMELLGGRRLVAFPKDKKAYSVSEEEQQKEKERMQRLFTDNAFMLLEEQEHIMSDSRLFLAQVPIESGLAYVGSGGFRNPTLGVYIEWWLNCPYSSVEDRNGRKWLVYKLAGSPLSGCNCCGLVDQDGNVKKEQLPHFHDAFHSFININQRYKEAKSKYYGFSLLQAIAFFAKEGKAEINDSDDIMFSQERTIQRISAECESLRQDNLELKDKLRRTFLRLKKPELKAYFEELNRKEENLNATLYYAETMLPLLSQVPSLASGQKERRKIRYEKRAAQDAYNDFKYNRLWEILEGEPIGFDEVERFIKEEKDA